MRRSRDSCLKKRDLHTTGGKGDPWLHVGRGLACSGLVSNQLAVSDGDETTVSSACQCTRSINMGAVNIMDTGGSLIYLFRER